MLNREKPSWMGCWNGIGGKLEEGEMPRASMLREIEEETGIDVTEITFKGLITWSYMDGSSFGGMFLYLADLSEAIIFPTPIKTPEGILDWKEIDWIKNPNNQGVAANIPPCLDKVLDDSNCYNHHSFFDEKHFVGQTSTILDPRIEADEGLRNEYLKTYASGNVKNPFAFLKK